MYNFFFWTNLLLKLKKNVFSSFVKYFSLFRFISVFVLVNLGDGESVEANRVVLGEILYFTDSKFWMFD